MSDTRTQWLRRRPPQHRSAAALPHESSSGADFTAFEAPPGVPLYLLPATTPLLSARQSSSPTAQGASSSPVTNSGELDSQPRLDVRQSSEPTTRDAEDSEPARAPFSSVTSTPTPVPTPANFRPVAQTPGVQSTPGAVNLVGRDAPLTETLADDVQRSTWLVEQGDEHHSSSTHDAHATEPTGKAKADSVTGNEPSRKTAAGTASAKKGAQVGRGGEGGAQFRGELAEASDSNILPLELAEQVDSSLEALPLDWTPLTSQWPLADSLASDALDMSPAEASKTVGSAARAVNEPKQASQPTQGSATPPPPDEDPVQKHAAEEQARDRAQRAYTDLGDAARQGQATFIEHANQITRSMADTYESTAQEVIRAHEGNLAAVQTIAERAARSVENAGSFAELALTDASRSAAASVESAGRRAYGLINADDRTAAQRIDEVVSGLVAGHQAAFNAAIASVRTAADNAVLTLNTWRDERTTNYSTSANAALENAKNESRQSRIPRWVDQEATRVGERERAKVTGWESSRDSTVCSLTCSYRAALDHNRRQTNDQGRSSVSQSLSRARRSLREQTVNGQHALADLKRSYLQQARTQQRAIEARLTTQARATLAALRRESQSALASMQSAARESLPTWWRGVAGFEQTLRKNAARGPAILQQTADNAPQGVLSSTQHTRSQLDERLDSNRSRLQNSLYDRASTQQRDAEEVIAQLDTTLRTQGDAAAARFVETNNSLVEAFNGLGGTVSQAAASWAQPLAVRMSGFIRGKQAEAAAALVTLLNGGTPNSGGSGGGGAAGAVGGAGGDDAAPSCNECASAAGSGSTSAGAAPAATQAGGSGAAPKGLTQDSTDEATDIGRRAQPGIFFAQQLRDTGAQVETNLRHRATSATGAFSGGFAGTVDETGVIAAFRGLTRVKGAALAVPVYPEQTGGRSLDADLRRFLGADTNDYRAASAYLAGDAVEGARLELQDSLGFFNDDEARIEAVTRALSPDQLAQLGSEHGDVVKNVREALDGTDLEVFNALTRGDYALADAFRLRDAVNEARGKQDNDAVHAAIEQFTGAAGDLQWGGQEVTADERRAAVVEALGGIVSDADVAQGAGEGGVATMNAEDRAVAFVTRDVAVLVDDVGGAHVELRGMEGANRDLAVALLRHGEDSVEARAARLGVEIQRTGDAPNPINIDRATFDPRFSSDLAHATPEEREAHRRAAEDRARVVMLAAQHYAGDNAAPEGFTPGSADPNHDPAAAMSDTRVTAARDRLIGQLRTRFGSDTVGADLAAGLLTDARPSADTAALAMRQAMYSHIGTNEELLFRFTERMNRDEIAAMRSAFSRQTGGLSLDAELGVFGEGGTFTELSGEDRLRMERAMMGVARNDRERLEVAAFALAQQRNESGGFGSWLADGTLADQSMRASEHQLEVLAGGPIALSRRGELLSHTDNFDPATGEYRGGESHDAFLSITSIAQEVAQNYSRRIDAFADIATTGIAILGAIAAAVITVVTGGAAAPLIAAAVVTGLASMAANYTIKGGRYGWEQAAIDLGMTAVQAITAGVGAQLGAAAQVASKGAAAASQATRTLAALSRIFTGNPVVDQIIVGAITGSISGLATTAINEQTWDSKDPVGALFGGLLRGALAGAATSAVTSSIENLGQQGRTISDRVQALTAERGATDALRNMLLRGGTRALLAGTGGVAGRTTEILFDTATGRFRGDAGDALGEIGVAGLHAALQGFGEGAGEAVGGGFHNARLRSLETDIARERASMGLPPLDHETLTHAAHDLLFLNNVGESGSLGRAIHLDHVATHGGLVAAVAPHDVEPALRAARPAGGEESTTTRTTPASTAEPESTAAQLFRSAEVDTTTRAPVPAGTIESVKSGAVTTATAEETKTISAEVAPSTRVHGGGGGDEGGGPPRAPRGGEEPQGNRPLRNLSDAELDAAFSRAQAGPLVRVGAEQPGADTRPLPVIPAGEPNLQQRQRAGALHEEAEGLAAQATARRTVAHEMEERARIAELSGNRERAGRLRNRAVAMHEEANELESQATTRRTEAAEFASGRRSATADLPGSEDIDAVFAGLQTEPGGLVSVPLSDLERNPQLLPRLTRSLLEGESGGRVVFRVESERSRSLVHVDAHRNVTIEGGASAHLNFGSFERAVEFVMNNSRGAARIIQFEVDESWVRAARSAAIPEHETAALAGRQPRLVDVRFADDQLEIPPNLIGELNRFIIPGSGRVHEIDTPAGGPPSPGSGAGGTVLPRPGGGPNEEGASPASGPQADEEAAAARILRGAVDTGTHGTADQTAGGISGARLTGDAAYVAKLQQTSLGHVDNSVRALAAPGGVLEGRLYVHDPAEGPTQIAIAARTAGERNIPVRIELADELPRVNGEMPAARYDEDPQTPGGYVIRVSRGTPASEVQRALAHEFTEIRAVHGTDGRQVDALGSGGSGRRLSPHDEGRLAELDVMARQIAALDPNHEATPATRRRLIDEAQRLVEHLGLLGDSAAATQRLGVARAALDERSPVRALLDEAVRTAADNPFLQRPTGKVEEDLQLLTRRREHARSLGDTDRALALREQAIVEQAALAVMRDRLVVTHKLRATHERPDGILVDLARVRIDALRARLTPEQQRLLDEAISVARRRPPLLADETRRPTPGFEAHFLSEPVAREELSLRSDFPVQLRRGKAIERLTVDEAVVRRRDLLERQRALRSELELTATPAARKVELQTEIEKLISPINRLSEALGVAAGRQFIANDPQLRTGRILELPREGAGIPDLIVELPPNPGGRLVIVECKGGDAKLGTRDSADRRFRVQQGRREYLESLAQEMERSKNYATIGKYGERLRKQLAAGDDVRYLLVRQPFDIDDKPTPPEVAEFDARRR